jgi:hypothetical protein
MSETQDLWSFYYHKGPAPKNGLVRARDERTAMLVATKWCVLNQCRPPASVQPYILADESILQVSTDPQGEELPGAIQATTESNTVNVR